MTMEYLFCQFLFYIHKMAKQSPLDVTSLHFTRISACVQVVYWYLKYQSAMQHIEIISQEKLKVKCACRALC